MPSISSILVFRKSTFYPFPHTHIFFINQKVFMNKVLSVLISINVQAKSDINLGSQGMVITNQGGGYPTIFSCKQKHMQFYKAGHWVVFIKTRTETCIKGWDWTCRLQSLPGDPARGTVLQVPARGTARWIPRQVLPRSHRCLRRTQTKHTIITQKNRPYR